MAIRRVSNRSVARVSLAKGTSHIDCPANFPFLPPQLVPIPQSGPVFSRFGRFRIGHRQQVFYTSKHSLGIVNIKPIVPGHVLVIPKRSVPRVADLTPDEVTDLFLSVRKIGPVIESHFGATALNIAIQDGVDAGQSVPHVHVHMLPRVKKDFEPNDAVYDAIESWNPHGVKAEVKAGAETRQKLQVPPDSERKVRTAEEMEREAEELRSLFPDNQPTL